MVEISFLSPRKVNGKHGVNTKQIFSFRMGTKAMVLLFQKRTRRTQNHLAPLLPSHVIQISGENVPATTFYYRLGWLHHMYEVMYN